MDRSKSTRRWIVGILVLGGMLVVGFFVIAGLALTFFGGPGNAYMLFATVATLFFVPTVFAMVRSRTGRNCRRIPRSRGIGPRRDR